MKTWSDMPSLRTEMLVKWKYFLQICTYWTILEYETGQEHRRRSADTWNLPPFEYKFRYYLATVHQRTESLQSGAKVHQYFANKLRFSSNYFIQYSRWKIKLSEQKNSFPSLNEFLNADRYWIEYQRGVLIALKNTCDNTRTNSRH